MPQCYMYRLSQIGIAVMVAMTLAAAASGAELANLRNGFTIRAERHESLGDTTRLYTGITASAGYIDIPTSQIEGFEPAPAELQPVTVDVSKAHDLKTLVESASERSQVDADFIASVIRAESGNNPKAVSRKGAQGLMQLMPATASQMGVTNSFDPAQNIDAGVRYLRDLLLAYNNDMVKALAAYNAGPQRVQQYKGVPPYRETHAYVARVITDYNRKKLAQRKQALAAASRTHARAKQAHVAVPAPATSPANDLAQSTSIGHSTTLPNGNE